MAKGASDDMDVKGSDRNSHEHGGTSGSADALAEAARAAARDGRPPVHLWDPPFCGDMDMVIRRDGTWLHEGTPIGRPALVRLFGSILRREGEEMFLVTPVEKLRITVEDAPFVAVDVEPEGDALVFETNLGERIEAGPGHAIRVEHRDGEPAPYVHVRDGLDALIDRKTFYRLSDLGETAEHEGGAWFGVRSRGTFFPMIPAEALDG